MSSRELGKFQSNIYLSACTKEAKSNGLRKNGPCAYESNVKKTSRGHKQYAVTIPGLGTKEALFGINVLFQRCLDINRDMPACYIDFGKVKHDKLLYQVVLNKNIDSDDMRIIISLYLG